MLEAAGFTAAYLTAGYAMWELSHPRKNQAPYRFLYPLLPL